MRNSGYRALIERARTEVITDDSELREMGRILAAYCREAMIIQNIAEIHEHAAIIAETAETIFGEAEHKTNPRPSGPRTSISVPA